MSTRKTNFTAGHHWIMRLRWVNFISKSLESFKITQKIILFIQGFEKIAEVLIKNGAEIDKQSNFLATPLFLAAANGNLSQS